VAKKTRSRATTRRQSSTSKKAPGIPPKGLVTRRQLAEALTVHPQSITKWEAEGLPVAQHGGKGRPSFYDETAVRAWRRERDEAAATGNGPLNPAQEKARRERAQAQLAEQTFQIRMRDLLPRDEVERLWSGEIAAVRAKLMAVPINLADIIHRTAHVDGVAAVEKILEDAMLDALRELADPARPLPSASAA
jgi:hypothetical protein